VVSREDGDSHCTPVVQSVLVREFLAGDFLVFLCHFQSTKSSRRS